MNHDNDKIEEIAIKHCLGDTDHDHVRSSEAMKEYAEYIREKTIKECMECVSDKDKPKLGSENQSTYVDFANGHNYCREQTLNNMSNLL